MKLCFTVLGIEIEYFFASSMINAVENVFSRDWFRIRKESLCNGLSSEGVRRRMAHRYGILP